MIARNKRNAAFLLASIFLLVALAFCFVPGVFFAGLGEWAPFVAGPLVAALYVGVTALLAIPISRSALGGRYPDPKDPLEVGFVQVAEQVAAAARLPLPGLLVEDAPDINAFAIGFRPERSFVAVSRGALERLTREELRGVVGHELGHLAARDTAIKTLALASLGAVDVLVRILKGAMAGVFGYGVASAAAGAASGDADARNAGFFTALGSLVFAVFLLAALAPLVAARFVANLLFFGMSRRQELRADAYAVQFTGDPRGLASALNKIRHEGEAALHRTATVSALHFSSHLSGGGLGRLLATHPPVEKRIQAILGEARYDAYGRLLGIEPAQGPVVGVLPRPLAGAPAPRRLTCPKCGGEAVAAAGAPLARCPACGFSAPLPRPVPASPAAGTVQVRARRSAKCPGCSALVPYDAPAGGGTVRLQCPACGKAGSLRVAVA